MSDVLVRTVRCPVCQRLPGMLISPRQAVCDTEGCPGLMFDPCTDPEQQLSSASVVDLVNGGPPVTGQPVEVSGWSPPPDTEQERRNEALVRDALHRRGLSCVPGTCRVCG